MWCANCRSEVAAEVHPDTRRAHCANCGGEIATPHARSASRTQQARELLERWAQDRTNDPFEAAPAVAAGAPPVEQAGASPQPAPAESPARVRIDAAHHEAETAAPPNAPPEPAPATQPPDGRRVDAAHALPSPHGLPAPATAAPAGKRPPKWVAVAGQTLAYVGVLGLMAGTCLVILGHFRGPASYAPTGWLITMAGQMLLFLGVVTLVSSGMEETTNTVADRIDRLNDQLLRIEEATESLRGAHFNVSPSPADADPATQPAMRQAS